MQTIAIRIGSAGASGFLISEPTIVPAPNTAATAP